MLGRKFLYIILLCSSFNQWSMVVTHGLGLPVVIYMQRSVKIVVISNYILWSWNFICSLVLCVCHFTDVFRENSSGKYANDVVHTSFFSFSDSIKRTFYFN